jgi:hypothetical protein
MASNEYGLFFNSVNGDRVYDADSFSDWLRKFFTSGVFQGELFVESIGGMDVRVSPGYSNIDGKVRFFDTENEFTISPAHSKYTRIDTIVVERNDTSRSISMRYIQGQYSGNTPLPTPPVRENGVYQLILAQITVQAGVTQIGQRNILDTRPDLEICGYVTGTVEEIDLKQILSQSEAQFDEWFERMKGQLSEDAAGNLQLQIDNIQNNYPIEVEFASIDSLPQTINNPAITENHVLLNYELSNPNAQMDDWIVTTANGSVTISGTNPGRFGSIFGSTNLKLILGTTKNS